MEEEESENPATVAYYKHEDVGTAYYNSKIRRYTNEDPYIYAPLVNIIKNYDISRDLNVYILLQVYKFMNETNDFWDNVRRTSDEKIIARMQKKILTQNFSGTIEPYIQNIIQYYSHDVAGIKANELKIIRLRLKATFLRYFYFLIALLKNE